MNTQKSVASAHTHDKQAKEETKETTPLTRALEKWLGATLAKQVKDLDDGKHKDAGGRNGRSHQKVERPPMLMGP